MNSRLTSLKNEIIKNKLDAVLISSIANIIYLTDFSHFSKEEREAFLLIVAQPQGLTHKTPGVLGYILTDGRYSVAVKRQIKNFELIEISTAFTFEKALKVLAKKHKIKRLGFEHHDITVSEHKKLSRVLNDLNHFTFDSLRIVKSPNEILNIQKACELGDKTFKYILTKIKLGVSEKQLAFEIEFFIKKRGADISFPPIVAFGKNSAIPHHKTSNQRLASSGQFVLLDFGIKVNNYCSDMTRTVFFGSLNKEQERMYQTVLEAQQKSIEYLVKQCHSERSEESHESLYGIAGDPSSTTGLTQDDKKVKASSVDKVARDYIVSKGFPTIPHSLGHGIGLEVHEAPRLSPKSKDILKPGMVFSIEPGIYVPNFGGIRVEDLVVIESNGPRLLTKSPKNLIQI